MMLWIQLPVQIMISLIYNDIHIFDYLDIDFYKEIVPHSKKFDIFHFSLKQFIKFEMINNMGVVNQRFN